MRKKTSKAKTETVAVEESELPFIDATTFYDTRGAAGVLGLTEPQLRTWRHRGFGPKYQQPSPNARCLYLGAWLIAFRRTMIVEPSMQGASR